MMQPLRIYYFANWCYRRRIPIIPKLMKLLIFIIYNAVVPYEASIGPNCKLGHGGTGVVIHPESVIGENVLIGTCVTIGGRKSGEAAPHIGNNVYIGTGAKILGSVTVNKNCVIGANAVVIKSIPSRCVAVGVPAKIVRRNIDSFDITEW